MVLGTLNSKQTLHDIFFFLLISPSVYFKFTVFINNSIFFNEY